MGRAIICWLNSIPGKYLIRKNKEDTWYQICGKFCLFLQAAECIDHHNMFAQTIPNHQLIPAGLYWFDSKANREAMDNVSQREQIMTTVVDEQICLPSLKLNFGGFLLRSFFKYELLLNQWEHRTSFSTKCSDVVHCYCPSFGNKACCSLL